MRAHRAGADARKGSWGARENESGRSLQTSASPSPCGSNDHLPHPPETTPLCHDARASPARRHRWSWKRTRTATNERQFMLSCLPADFENEAYPAYSSEYVLRDRSSILTAPASTADGRRQRTDARNGMILAFGRTGRTAGKRRLVYPGTVRLRRPDFVRLRASRGRRRPRRWRAAFPSRGVIAASHEPARRRWG